MRRTLDSLLVLSVLLAPASPSFAQNFGQITGRVLDASGAVLPGATVTVTNPQTGIAATEQANTAGVYVFPNLLPGTYNVKVELQGFQSAVRNGVELQTQQTVRMDFSLAIGTLAETVEIVGSAPMINTEDTAIGTVIDNRRIVDLPLNGRNFLQLVSLTPNVSASFANSGQSGARQGGDRSEQQLSIAGGRREWNYYTLDGMNNTDVNFNSYILLPSIDALQEFKIQSGIYSAEFGRGIGQVNVVTKSGTNDLPRHRVGVRPQQQPRRPSVRLRHRHTEIEPVQVEPVRVHARRSGPDSPPDRRAEQAFLHGQLRGLPVAQPERHALQRAVCGDAAGRFLADQRRYQRPAHRRAISRKHHPRVATGPHLCEHARILPAA